jgi:hypothetical protein
MLSKDNIKNTVNENCWCDIHKIVFNLTKNNVPYLVRGSASDIVWINDYNNIRVMVRDSNK